MPEEAPQELQREERAAPPRERDYLLPGSILIAGILISGSIVYLVGSAHRGADSQTAQVGNNTQEATAPATLELTARDVILGDPKAPVTLIEYGDYQCPFCARFFKGAETQIRASYIKDGKVRMVFRNLSFLGPESTAAALAAECAKDQGKFWPFHDAIYDAEHKDAEENSGNLNRALFLGVAGNTGMDVKAFTSCFDGKKYADEVVKQNDSARALGVNSTPTTFVNGQLLQGALPFASFQAVIDKALGNG